MGQTRFPIEELTQDIEHDEWLMLVPDLTNAESEQDQEEKKGKENLSSRIFFIEKIFLTSKKMWGEKISNKFTLNFFGGKN